MSDTTEKPGSGRDFIRQIVDEDVRTGKYERGVITRFPPEPNGFLHVGHPSAICLDFDVAAEHGGRTHLRFDDTNPEGEEMRFVEAMQEDIRWLGYDWGEHLYFASDYFEQLYAYAVELIEKGLAYVDSQTLEEIRENRGTVTEPGRPGPFRDRSVDENLDLFRRMRAGEFDDGAHVLRAKIDLGHSNMVMRDPVLYRIRHATHYRKGDEWCIYPLYDFTHCLSDSIEGITHSFCTLEFVPNREIYDWLLDNLDVPRPQPRQFEFARLNIEYTVTSKRKLGPLIEAGIVSGWDDPRMPTIRGFRRRGYTPDAIKAFARGAGISKVEKRIDVGKLEYAIRTDLNDKAPRVMAVLDPLEVEVTTFPEGEIDHLDAPYFPSDIGKEGSRRIPFTRRLYIERSDFEVEPPKGFRRLVPDGEVRLRYGYVIRCDEVVTDDEGRVTKLLCSHDPDSRGGNTPDGRKVKGTIHWVSASESFNAPVMLYDRLFDRPDPEELAEGEDIFAAVNPKSLVRVENARLEPSLKEAEPEQHYQFERQGFFVVDRVDSEPGAPVFNRVVTLKDSWAKKTASSAPVRTKKPKREAPQAPVERVYRPEDEAAAARFDAYTESGVSEEDARVLALDESLGGLFDAARNSGGSSDVASWVVHEVSRVVPEGGSAVDLAFGGAELVGLIELVDAGTLTRNGARQVLDEMARSGGSPEALVESLGLKSIDEGEVVGWVDGVIAENPDKVEAYRGGKSGLIGFFMGQVMRRAGGKADGETVQRLLRERLDG